jgi:hypothetical protein
VSRLLSAFYGVVNKYIGFFGFERSVRRDLVNGEGEEGGNIQLLALSGM